MYTYAIKKKNIIMHLKICNCLDAFGHVRKIVFWDNNKTTILR